MSTRAARRLLWVAALVLVPLPMFVFDAFVPVANYLLMAAVCIGMRIAEGPGGVVWQLTGLFAAHAVVYAVLLYLAAWAIARGLGRLAPVARAAVVVIVVVGGAGLAIATRPYVTPFGSSARSSLVGVLQ